MTENPPHTGDGTGSDYPPPYPDSSGDKPASGDYGGAPPSSPYGPPGGQSGSPAGGQRGPSSGEYAPPGGQYGSPPGRQYGSSGSGQHAPPGGHEYGSPSGGQYGQPPDAQFGASSGGQYGQPGGARYGSPGGQYGPPGGGQYGPAGGGQYGAPGGYGPPPAYGASGGYPPPGYPGAPGYGGGGYAAPPLLGIGDALNYGWTRFAQNALNWILLLLVILVGFAVVAGILIAVLIVPSASSNSTAVASFVSIGTVVFLLVLLALAFLTSVVTTLGGLREVDGAKPAFGDFFRFQNLGAALGAAALVGVLVWVGSLLCYVPGLIVAFFGMFTVPFVLDKGMGAWTALQASFSLVSANLGPLFLLYLAVAALNWVGSLLLGIGLLATMPMTTIALMYAYRLLTGGPVAPLATASPY